MLLARIRAHRHLLWPLLVLVVASVFFLYRLDLRKLEKSDEALYAAAALELVNGANPLFPRGQFSDYRRMGKPPGALWPPALLIKVFGRSKVAVRLPTMLAGIAAIFLVYLIGAAIARHRAAGALAALLALTPGLWLEMARMFWLENTLTALFLAAIWIDARGRAAADPRRQLWLHGAAGALIGYAILVKHAVGLAPLGALLVAELVTNPAIAGQPRRLARRFGPLLGGALLVSGPWLAAFVADAGIGAPLAEIGKKLGPDTHGPRSANDVWKMFLTLVEPWYLLAGLACLVALLLLIARRRRTGPGTPPPQPLAAMTAPDPAFLVVACAALFASHLVVFCIVSDKLRGWYMLPVIPLLGLAIGTVVGGAALRRLPRLGALAFVVVLGGLSASLDPSLPWQTSLAVALGALFLWIAVRRAVPLLLRNRPRWESRVGRWLPSTLTALALVALLGGGLKRSAQFAWRDYPVDNFAYYAALWQRQPPARLVIDQSNWERPLYMTPSVYYYFSPLPIAPHRLDLPCDISDLPPGEHVMLHITKYQCVAPRVREVRELGPWWRLVVLR
ncbi:MAG: glycosyltransferase family 39 protein [Deltaproteobacteria bacterium]|nr:glycosyltransferase family 39 protein [Deltaproteobacteria bacterium]